MIEVYDHVMVRKFLINKDDPGNLHSLNELPRGIVLSGAEITASDKLASVLHALVDHFKRNSEDKTGDDMTLSESQLRRVVREYAPRPC